jgi:hypothetical protein
MKNPSHVTAEKIKIGGHFVQFPGKHNSRDSVLQTSAGRPEIPAIV